MTHLVANPVKMEINGLCNYSADPEDWFDYRKAKQCKRICGNCPLRQASASGACCKAGSCDNGHSQEVVDRTMHVRSWIC